MRYPITSFIRFRLGEFSRYRNVVWIVTGKSFSETIDDRLLLTSYLSSTAHLLGGTVIVINRYAAHFDGPAGNAIAESVKLLRLLLQQFADVCLEDQQYVLRWVLDPSIEQLESLFLEESTKFVLAAFEASEGMWQIADFQPTKQSGEPSGPVFFHLSRLKGRLDHIQLLRVFHCNSAFRPYDPGQPADDNTLVRQLLETGARVVEGGLTRESYFEFFHSVLHFIFNSGLFSILESRAAEGAFSLIDIWSRCNELLQQCGYDPIILSTKEET